MALERIGATVDGKESAVGCPWAIRSAEHNYCFWVLADDLHGSPMPDREIGDMLGMSQQQINQTLQSALRKLESVKDTEEAKDLRDAIVERLAEAPVDHTLYYPMTFGDPEVAEEIKKTANEPEAIEEKLLRDKSMPIHRSGKRRDLYGIYSKAALEKLHGKKS